MDAKEIDKHLKQKEKEFCKLAGNMKCGLKIPVMYEWFDIQLHLFTMEDREAMILFLLFREIEYLTL